MVSEETLEGLGTTGFLLETLFGSILRIASSGVPGKPRPGPPLPTGAAAPAQNSTTTADVATSTQPPRQHQTATSATAAALQSTSGTTLTTTNSTQQPMAPSNSEPPVATDSVTGRATKQVKPTEVKPVASTARTPALGPLAGVTSTKVTLAGTGLGPNPGPAPIGSSESESLVTPSQSIRLTDIVPQPGYFLAGAVAGAASRTGTAPIDRLKVYLIVNTAATGETAIKALRRGQPVVAFQNAARPFSDAVKDIWKSGGIRTFFAGKHFVPCCGVA